MTNNTTKERANLREAYINKLTNVLFENDEEVLQVASNRLALPVVGESGNEFFVTITVAVPTGERGGEPYDGYAMEESYKIKLEKKKGRQMKDEKYL